MNTESAVPEVPKVLEALEAPGAPDHQTNILADLLEDHVDDEREKPCKQRTIDFQPELYCNTL